MDTTTLFCGFDARLVMGLLAACDRLAIDPAKAAVDLTEFHSLMDSPAFKQHLEQFRAEAHRERLRTQIAKLECEAADLRAELATVTESED